MSFLALIKVARYIEMQSDALQATWTDREAVCVNEGRPVRFAAFTASRI